MSATRPYLIEEYLQTVCPACFEERRRRSDEESVFIEGMLVSHDGKVFMHRFCPVHGESESLYEEDLELWRMRFGWSTPTSPVTPDRLDWKPGLAGYSEGLPASHGQHTCVLVLNITERCNLSCPTCYAAALGPETVPSHANMPTLEELLFTVDTVIEREGGRIGVVMLSGGEPTVRKDIVAILEALAERPITRILLNTNGRRIARDDEFCKALGKMPHRVEVYLQFDGFSKPASLALRGEDLVSEKEEAVSRLMAMGVCTSLVCTVVGGVNDDRLGEVFQYGLGQKYVTGIAYQPVFGSGRGTGVKPVSRVTPTGVARRLADQCPGIVQAGDFIPLPCSHRDCCDIGYWIKANDGSWKSLMRFISPSELKNWIHLVSNTISFENSSELVKAMVKDGALQRVLSEQQSSSSLQLALDVVRMCDCVPGLADLAAGLWKRVKGEQGLGVEMATNMMRVTVKQFMDTHTFHSARLKQCCVHTGTFEDDPRRLSFCWRWLFEDATDFPAKRLTPLPQVKS